MISAAGSSTSLSAGRRESSSASPRPAPRDGAVAFSDVMRADTVVHLSARARDFLADPPPPMDWHRPTFDTGAAGSSAAPPATATATANGDQDASARATRDREVEQLRARDTEVRAHEAAHAGAAGTLGGQPSLEYTIGPDGKRYAVNGEVSIDTSPGRTPEETITRARTIRAAATAPASPSAQDLAVASAATRMEAQARSEIREQQQTKSVARTKDPRDEERAAAPDKTGDRGELRAARHQGPSDVLLQLDGERNSARSDSGHQHLASQPCVTCSRAVSAYA